MENTKKGTGDAENKLSRSIRQNISSYAMVIALLVIWLLFAVTTKEGVFLGARNLSMLFRQTTTMGLLSIGMSYCIISGNFDLSVGSVVGFTGLIVALGIRDWGLSAEVSIIIALATGAAIGFWNGFWIAVHRIPAFIVTLGGMMVFRGLTHWVSQGKGVAVNHEWFSQIDKGYIPTIAGWILAAVAILAVILMDISNRKQRKFHGFELQSMGKAITKYVLSAALILIFTYVMNDYKGIPIPVLILIGIFLLFSFVLKKTAFGRHVYAIGGNENAAKLSGINIRKTTWTIFVLMGVVAALAGVILTARNGTGTTDAGTTFEMYAIAGCVIGGISLLGGRGKIFGVLVGALVIASLNNGMSLLGMESSYQKVVTGLILILAVWFDIVNTRKNEK